MSRIAIFLIAAGVISGNASAQVLTQPGSSPPPSNTTGGQPQKQTLGGDLPFLDPGSEVAQWDGHTWNVTNNRVFNARFEKYLAAPAADSEEDQAYRDVMDAILKELSPSRSGGANLPGGVALLPEAAQFPIDARLCDSLANSIWGVWLSQKNVYSLNAANAAMDKRVKDLARNYEVGSEGRKLRPAAPSGAQNGGGGGGQPPQTASQTAAEFSRLTEYIADATELKARQALNKTEIALSGVKAKVEFQALIVQFFLQRRFEHAVIGCRFYRNLFRDGDGSLELKDGSDVQKMFASGLGFDPTIGTLDTFSNEAIRDVDEGIRAFEELAAQGDLESASKRLSEAFLIGEYLPRVRRLPLDEKRKVLVFVRDSNQLLSALEVRNYGLAEEVLDRMKNVARDFDHSKPEAAIQAAKTVATMHLTAAKIAAQKGDEARVYDEMRKATEIWPNNPDLSELADLIGENSDIESQATIQLDRLISERAHRKIFAEKEKFGAAVRADPQRLAQLREIVESVAKIDMVIYASQQQQDAGSVSAAWETVKRATEEHPNDSELQKRIQILTEAATDLVGVLSKARTLEDDGEYGSSLTRYLEAKEIFPSSKFASEGIERVLQQIRPGNSSGIPSGGPFEFTPEPAAPAPSTTPAASPTPPSPPSSGGGFAL